MKSGNFIQITLVQILYYKYFFIDIVRIEGNFLLSSTNLTEISSVQIDFQRTKEPSATGLDYFRSD